ncbi:MAG TPA: GIY-YIG nuclease family protein [Chthoniobacter sp.]|jgi:putative endonuclease
MREDFWAYIAGNKRRSSLYTGMTNDLERRMWEHKHPNNPKAFTARYRVTELLWCERFPTALDAIACEKRIKGLSRAKKVAMISAQNPEWEDLSADWYG